MEFPKTKEALCQGFEKINLSPFRFNQANTGDDAIVGSVRNDRLYGGMLSDLIMGAEGQDVLYGLAGNQLSELWQVGRSGMLRASGVVA